MVPRKDKNLTLKYKFRSKVQIEVCCIGENMHGQHMPNMNIIRSTIFFTAIDIIQFEVFVTDWQLKRLDHCDKQVQIWVKKYPGIHFRLKVIPPWMKIRSFLDKCFSWISIRTGLRRLNWVVSHQQHQQTRNAAQFWATEVFELSYLSTKIICNKTGGSCIKRIPEVDYVRQRNNFFKTCSRLVDVLDDMIPFC